MRNIDAFVNIKNDVQFLLLKDSHQEFFQIILQSMSTFKIKYECFKTGEYRTFKGGDLQINYLPERIATCHGTFSHLQI